MENYGSDKMPLKTLSFANAFSPFSDGRMLCSPMSELAFNLEDLTTSHGGTPKKRLSLSDSGTPTPVRAKPAPVRPTSLMRKLSEDGGCCMDSPSPTDMLEFDSRYSQDCKKVEARRIKRPSAVRALRRYKSMPVQPSDGSSPLSTRMGVVDHSPVNFKRFGGRTSSSGNPSPVHRSLFYVSDDDDSSDHDTTFTDENSNSQDSGFSCHDKSLFAQPSSLPPRRTLQLINEDTCSPLKYSPNKGSPTDQMRPISAPAATALFDSPDKLSGFSLRTSSLTSSVHTDDGDDGFLELWDDNENDGPAGLDSLLAGPMAGKPRAASVEVPTIQYPDPEDMENTQPDQLTCKARMGLFRSPSAPRLMAQKSLTFEGRQRFKRPEPPRDYDSPIQNKRRRSIRDSDDTIRIIDSANRKSSILHRSISMMDTRRDSQSIKDALTRSAEQPDLLGDFSKPYCLPTIAGRHQDLQSITPDTMAALLNNEYSHVVEKFMIIDCRYPYEYEGGHIEEGENHYTKDAIIQQFLRDDQLLKEQFTPPCGSQPPAKRTILIFHCEFSSERGPKLMRFLRNKDRDAHKDLYPTLKYPEIYLLHNGYKEFYENHKELCQPQTYKPMLHENHSADLKHFRTKSKSWAGGEKQRNAFRPGLKF